MKKRTAFSVAEVVVALVIISVFLAATLPSFTGKKNVSKGTDYSTRTCIVKENASSVDTTTAPPFDTEFNSASADCKTVISNTAKNIGQSFDTLVYYSTEGTAAEQAAADKVIRAACDMGAVEACKYFIRRCSGDSTKCDISTTANNNDLHYYLTLASNDLNPGRLVIMKEILPVYYSGETNLKAEVKNACTSSASSACQLLKQSCTSSTNCTDVVTGCNASTVSDCKAGYFAGINRTCMDIRQNSPVSSDGAYRLTNATGGNGTATSVYCDLKTQDGGWALVRRVAPSLGATYPVNDNLAGTSAYSTYYANPTQNATFSMKFDNYPFTEMRFATGDNAKWLVVDKSAVYDDWDASTNPKFVRIKRSHVQNTPYNVFWLKRTPNTEDPWISAYDHASFSASCSADNDNHSMLYGEGGAGCWDYYDTNHNGLNVWVRDTGISETGTVTYKSCAEIKNNHSNIGSGVYSIDPDGTGGNAPFSVYCDMSSDGGGWTLVMKVDGSLTTFSYASTYWTNDTTYNTSSLDTSKNELKSFAFSTLPFSKIRVVLDTGGTVNAVTAYSEAAALKTMFTGAYKPFSTPAGKDQWRFLVPGSSVQVNCNQEGFNAVRLRIGFSANNEADCSSNDSQIGVGLTNGSTCSTTYNGSAGNVSGCTDGDNGIKTIYSFAYVYVK